MLVVVVVAEVQLELVDLVVELQVQQVDMHLVQ
jgi:hypothetical protein